MQAWSTTAVCIFEFEQVITSSIPIEYSTLQLRMHMYGEARAGSANLRSAAGAYSSYAIQSRSGFMQARFNASFCRMQSQPPWSSEELSATGSLRERGGGSLRSPSNAS
jgi:hypothetical protein